MFPDRISGCSTGILWSGNFRTSLDGLLPHDLALGAEDKRPVLPVLHCLHTDYLPPALEVVHVRVSLRLKRLPHVLVCLWCSKG
jgi:hypothetical protein